MAVKGSTWNESEIFQDPVTLRSVRRVTTTGQYNNTPTYHTNTAFTADGEYVIFASARHGRSAVYRCRVETGEITCLTEPVPGLGSRGELHGLSPLSRGLIGDGRGICGSFLVAPVSRTAIFGRGNEIRLVHIDTLDERVLIAGEEERIYGVASVDPDETHVLVVSGPAHPQILAGERVTGTLGECLPPESRVYRLHKVPLDGGEPEIIREEIGVSMGHCQYCPTDPDLLLMDRNDSNLSREEYVSRLWLLRISSGELTPLAPRDENPFQIHATWSWDGRYVVYHGESAHGGYHPAAEANGGIEVRDFRRGWYIGVIGRDARVLREYCFPMARYYGHVAAMKDRPAVILDGNLFPDMLYWLYYDAEAPRIEIIARHDSDITTMPGQYGHVHQQCDPTGRYIVFNSAPLRFIDRGRSDVYVVKV